MPYEPITESGSDLYQKRGRFVKRKPSLPSLHETTFDYFFGSMTATQHLTSETMITIGIVADQPLNPIM